jgi:hypothetical protein
VSSTSESNPPLRNSIQTGRLAPRKAAVGVVQLTGTVEQGVESGCIVLLDDSGSAIAQLMGMASSAYSYGSRMQVTGEYVPGFLTKCQQGPPFTVHSVRLV